MFEVFDLDAAAVRRTVIVAVFALLWVGFSSGQSFAYNQSFPEFGSTFLCGDLDESQYSYSNNTEWTSSMKSEFDSGFDAWVYDVEKYSGGYLLSESGTNWIARWDSIGGDTARTECFIVHNITFNTLKLADFQSGALDLSSVAAHEWGHAFGSGHVGEEDLPLTSEEPPTMSTCNSTGLGNLRTSLSRDDEASITSANESVSGYKTATANSSFEENESSHLEYWRTQQVASFYASTSGGGVDGSPYYGVFRANAGVTNGAIYSDTYVTADNGERYKARANYKKSLSTDYGTIQVTMKTRVFEHQANSGCGGANINETVYQSGWRVYNKTCTPQTSWSYCTTPVLTFSGYDDSIVHHARVVVYNRMQAWIGGGPGGNTSVRTDRDRVMLDGISG
ncbi:MAG: hypothetical protein DWP92_03275 [Armatimonadetes bacterium]|nr:MAG: hypothetical protein DWP92_03275 [Armatimonadota bacterium]